MSQEVEESDGALENNSVDVLKEEKDSISLNNVMDQNLVKENGLNSENMHFSYSQDELLQMVVELNFQKAYINSQYEELQNHLQHSDQHDQPKTQEDDRLGSQEDTKQLHGVIESLRRELLEERQTRGSAEEALKHLRASDSVAETRAKELSVKLAEAQQKMDQEIKERDEKYAELDSKFNRLHKRAKQRIQEVQKEKDDLEAQLHEIKEKADLASSQLSSLQQELDRTRQHANEALKAMDGERQQLRSTNNRLRDNLEELRNSLAPKENALEAMQQSLLEKEQMLAELRGLLQAADDKQQATITELSQKHQKQVDDMQAQIAEVLAERNRATETISSLRALIAEKDTKIAEMDAASSGEIARLRAAMETLKGEFSHLRNEHDQEKEGLEATLLSMRSKLEISESNRIHAEVEAAKLRSQLESELSGQTQQLNAKDAELEKTKAQIKRIESEFVSYKARAHALLQKKDSELAAARDNVQLKALEEALKDAEREIQLVSSEKDKALKDLKDALTNSDKEIASRDVALSNADKQMKSLQLKLDSALSMHQSEKEEWERNLKNMEETWRLRSEALEMQTKESHSPDLQKEVEDLKSYCEKLKEERNSLRDLADKMMEDKEKEISRLLDENKNLHQLLDSRPSAEDHDGSTALQKQDASSSSTSVAEQQILILARQQAQREEELAQTQRHILALQEEIEELEHENRLHQQQETMLKEELRNMERSQKREGVDLTYLKNVILKLLETGEVERLLPVIGMLLQFSPDELQKCQQAYRAAGDAVPSPSSDSGRSLFSRFTFT